MEIKYSVYKEDRLIIQKFYGTFSIETYTRYSQFISSIPEAKSINKVLLDFRDIDFKGLSDDPSHTLDKVTDIRKKINTDVLQRTNIKHVIWVDKPLPTAVIQMFIGKFPDLDYKSCTTLATVLQNLELPAHLIDLEKITSNLKNTY
jgi:hypothetical protein